MSKKLLIGIALLAVLTLLVGATVLAVPTLRDSVAFKVNQVYVSVRYALFPPEEAVFVPQANVEAAVQATLQSFTAVPSPTLLLPSPTPTLAPELPTATPAPTATPIPGAFTIANVPYFDQHGLWNYCAPANLAMGLAFWGWEGGRETTGAALKPYDKDKNVMLYEMVDYVNEQTAFSAEMRAGGTQQVLKRLIAAGYPVLVEKGPFIEFAGKVSWMGHYALLTAYDDAKGEFLSQDSYYSADYPIPYATLDDEWRAFNYLFMVIYPPDQRDQVLSLLGELADPTASYQIALERARAEATALTGLQGFFAQFNIGTSLTSLQDFPGAAAAFDQAFLLLPQLPAAQRPWRMMWYQTGPYFAYYFTGRYQDVINLADNTLNNISEPYLEESFVWRARARIALGDTQAAIADVEKALEYHPGFVPAVDLARQLGISG